MLAPLLEAGGKSGSQQASLGFSLNLFDSHAYATNLTILN